MARKSVPTTYVEWFTIPISWIIGFALVVLIGAGAFVYFRWVRPYVQQQPTIEDIVPQPEAATFSRIEGRVEVKRSGEYIYRPADFRMQLRENDLIRTGPNGLAEIICPNGTRIRVNPDTLLRLECTQRRERPQIAQLEIGAVQVEVSHENALVTTQTDVRAHLQPETIALIRLRGEDMRSFVEVERGRALVESRTERVEVGTGEGAAVEAEGTIEKRKLLEAPVVRYPGRRQIIPVQPGEYSSVRLEWSGVPEAVAYRVEIDDLPDMAHPMRWVIPRTFAVVEIPNRFIGVWYFWRVRAIDAHGVLGYPSEVRSFMLAKDVSRLQTIQCNFQARQQMTFSSFVIIVGRAHPSCIVRIGNELVKIQSSGRFRFFYKVKKTGVTHETVRVENPQGEVTLWTMEVRVTEEGIRVRFYPKS